MGLLNLEFIKFLLIFLIVGYLCAWNLSACFNTFLPAIKTFKHQFLICFKILPTGHFFPLETRYWSSSPGYGLQLLGRDGKGVFWFAARWWLSGPSCEYPPLKTCWARPPPLRLVLYLMFSYPTEMAWSKQTHQEAVKRWVWPSHVGWTLGISVSWPISLLQSSAYL